MAILSAIIYLMKKWLLVLFIFLAFPKITLAQTPPPFIAPKQDFFKATVIEIVDHGEKEIEGKKNYFQTLRIKINDGTEKGKFTIVENGKNFQITKDQLLTKNQSIIIAKTTNPDGKTAYSIYDIYRLDSISILVVVFFLLVLFIAGKKGLGSIMGMILSLGVITFYIMPNILKGADPLNTTLIGSIFILITTGYLAHGISKKTTIALFSTFISLILTVLFASLAINFSHLTGLGSEDAVALQFGPTAIINLKGLFLSGVIIGTLGALNDITTTQAATVYELKMANPKLKLINLFEKGISVGKEHAASLVNTLVLAYAGSALGVFIFLILNPANIPYWVIINNETLTDEIVKAIAGSSGLLLSVPIVTLIASYAFSKMKVNE